MKKALPRSAPCKLAPLSLAQSNKAFFEVSALKVRLDISITFPPTVPLLYRFLEKNDMSKIIQLIPRPFFFSIISAPVSSTATSHFNNPSYVINNTIYK
tara:strand:- start:139 stop:435 length:297 start_codon:yes stop_codon:yes gene_type:complete